MLFTARVAGLALTLLRLKFVAVYLGVETFGIYTFATYFVMMFGVLFDLGLPQIITREIATDHSKTSSYIFNALLLKAVLVIGTSILIALITVFSGFGGLTNWAIFFSVIIVGTNSLTIVFVSSLQAHRKMKLVSLLSLATDITTSLVIIGVLWMGHGLRGLLIGSAIVGTLSLPVAYAICKKSLLLSPTAMDRSVWKHLLREGYPIAFSSLGISLYLYLTSTLLKYMKGDEIVGYYNAAFKIISILTLIPSTFVQVVYPFFSELYASGAEKLRSVLEVSVRFMLIISIPLSVGTILIADKLVVTLYTEAFRYATTPLRILMLANLLGYANWVLYTFLAAINQQRFGMYITLTAGIAVVIANYFLIPTLGLTAPSISLACVEFALFVGAFLYLRQMNMKLRLKKILLKPLLACLVMAVVVYLLTPFRMSVQIVSGIIIYTIAFLGLGGILEEDRPILERILPVPVKDIVLSKRTSSS